MKTNRKIRAKAKLSINNYVRNFLDTIDLKLGEVCVGNVTYFMPNLIIKNKDTQ